MVDLSAVCCQDFPVLGYPSPEALDVGHHAIPEPGLALTGLYDLETDLIEPYHKDYMAHPDGYCGCCLDPADVDAVVFVADIVVVVVVLCRISLKSSHVTCCAH